MHLASKSRCGRPQGEGVRGWANVNKSGQGWKRGSILAHILWMSFMDDPLNMKQFTGTHKSILRLHSRRHEYEYESGFPFMARRSFTHTTGAFTVTCTST